MSPSVIPWTPSGVAPWLLLTSPVSWSLPSKLDLPFEHGLGRAGHAHRCWVSVPFDRQQAAAGLDIDPRIEQAETDTDGDGGARAGAARQRLARAALVHAQAHAVAGDDLQIAGVDA